MCRPVMQRSILRTHARHCRWVTAKNEESSPGASAKNEESSPGASGLSGLHKSCATRAGGQSRSGTIVARPGATGARGDDIFRG